MNYILHKLQISNSKFKKASTPEKIVYITVVQAAPISWSPPVWHWSPSSPPRSWSFSLPSTIHLPLQNSYILHSTSLHHSYFCSLHTYNYLYTWPHYYNIHNIFSNSWISCNYKHVPHLTSQLGFYIVSMPPPDFHNLYIYKSMNTFSLCNSNNTFSITFTIIFCAVWFYTIAACEHLWSLFGQTSCMLNWIFRFNFCMALHLWLSMMIKFQFTILLFIIILPLSSTFLWYLNFTGSSLPAKNIIFLKRLSSLYTI